MADAVAVDGKVDEVDDGVNTQGDADRWENALVILFDHAQSEKQDGDACLQNMGEIVEGKGGGQDLKIRLRRIHKDGKEGSEAPDDQQVAENATSCKNGDRKKNC